MDGIGNGNAVVCSAQYIIQRPHLSFYWHRLNWYSSVTWHELCLISLDSRHSEIGLYLWVLVSHHISPWIKYSSIQNTKTILSFFCFVFFVFLLNHHAVPNFFGTHQGTSKTNVSITSSLLTLRYLHLMDFGRLPTILCVLFRDSL